MENRSASWRIGALRGESERFVLVLVLVIEIVLVLVIEIVIVLVIEIVLVLVIEIAIETETETQIEIEIKTPRQNPPQPFCLSETPLPGCGLSLLHLPAKRTGRRVVTDNPW